MQSCDTMYFKLKFWNKLDLDVLQNIMLKNKANQYIHQDLDCS